jgi:hypothetical protein
MKIKELSIKTIAEILKGKIGENPNYLQLERNTGVERHVIKAMHLGERDYKISSLLKLCNELKIDLLK